ncbi:hypothetical protein SteCoe_25954 [Stentor coeruleus]|uniref:Uncharacterized protein n=1 Tax=Stentor coeruleus TaxID=5963 RepID=A0A1R2BE20_9CILI|nr:hypothetical protein SteCoe_25954 [Stentor coeruleus]
MTLQRFWSTRKSIPVQEIKDKPSSILSYRISSVPLKKPTDFIIKAQKKPLSPIPTMKIPRLTYLFTPMNRTFNYSKPTRKAELFSAPTAKNPISNSPQSQKSDFSKHFPLINNIHSRAKSIENTIARETLKTRKKYYLATAENFNQLSSL